MRKCTVAPSILSADFNIMGQQLKEIENTGLEMLHVDVMDGMFVPSISFGMPVITSIRKNCGMEFDVHLMINEPIRYIKEFKESGADSITFHIEATERIEETISKIREYGCKVGISIKPATSPEAIIPYAKLVDVILVMTVEPGFGGQAYIPSSTEKIKKTREILDGLGCIDTDIQVDGGIGTANIEMVKNAGANIFVAGSSVFKGNITENIRNLMEKL